MLLAEQQQQPEQQQQQPEQQQPEPEQPEPEPEPEPELQEPPSLSSEPEPEPEPELQEPPSLSFFGTCPGVEGCVLEELHEVYDSALLFAARGKPGRVQFRLRCVTSDSSHLSVPRPDPRVLRCFDNLYLRVGHSTDGATLPCLPGADVTLQTFADGLAELGKTWEQAATCWRNAYAPPTRGASSKNGEEWLPSFRVKCDRDKSGPYIFNSRQAARMVADIFGSHLIASGLGRWPVDLSANADAVLQVHLDSSSADIGLLLHQPFPNARAVAMPSAMSVRESIAAAIARMARVQCGDVVLDPMVGSGSLLVQATEIVPRCGAVIGADIHPVARARANLCAGSQGFGKIERNDACSNRTAFDVLCADVRRQTFRDASIDCVICDLPFGKRCMQRDEIPSLYSRLLGELARVLRPGTGRGVLMTGDAHLILSAMHAPFWEPVQTNRDRLFVRHGPSSGPGSGWISVIVVRRSVVPFQRSRRARKRSGKCLQCGTSCYRQQRTVGLQDAVTEWTCECGKWTVAQRSSR